MIERLKMLGFSDNESKVYLELLKRYPETAYQIAKRTGLASANVYQVLAAMVKKGFVAETEGEKKLFKPVDPSNWITDKKAEFAENIDHVEETLHKMFQAPDEDYFIYRLKNKTVVTRKVKELIESAEIDIYFDLFPSNFKSWRKHLITASERGITVKGIIYEELKPINDNFLISMHPASKFVLEEHEADLFSLLIDAKEAIFGIIGKDGTLESCFWSKNSQLCFMLESGMRSEMMHWYMLQNVDASTVFSSENYEYYKKLRISNSLVKRLETKKKAID